jgi:hypothetical protein
MDGGAPRVPVMKFCCHCHCGCPELFLAPDAPEDRRIVMTDDFGQQIEISVDQFRTFLRHVKSGELEETLLSSG